MKSLRRHSLSIVATGFAMLLGLSSNAAEPRRPNLVFVLFDDLGYEQPQSYNAKSPYSTPNLDRLAAQGMRFTDAHSASSVCTPTRYGIMTGRYPWRRGQYEMVDRFCPPLIPASRETIATVLQKAGYDTALFGKWHLGAHFDAKKDSAAQAFPLGTHCAEGPATRGFAHCDFYTDARAMGTLLEGDRVVAELQPGEVLPWLESKVLAYLDSKLHDRQPFFLYVSLPSPHVPLVAAPGFRGKTSAGPEGDWLFQADALLGELVDRIDRAGAGESTLVIAASDNGRDGENLPLRDGKGGIYEGGHRIPFIARWTGRIKAGAVSNALVSLDDLFATAAELAGAKIPPTAAEDSVSQLPVFLGKARMARSGLVTQSYFEDLALRDGSWKLIVKKKGDVELYDLRADPRESHDLAATNPRQKRAMWKKLVDEIERGRSTGGPRQANEAAPQWVIERYSQLK